MRNLRYLSATSIRRISLFFILLQSIGIRFFSGVGITLVLIVILLNFKNIKKITQIKHLTILNCLVVAIIIISLIKHLSLFSILYIVASIICAVLALLNYNSTKVNFIDDLKPVLWFFAVYGFVSWTLLVICPGLFKNVYMGLNYSTFLYVLYNNAPGGDLPRLSSLCWEPGCCQLILNLLLIILVTRKARLYKIIFIAFLVLLTRSTTGYINLLFVVLLYIRMHKDKMVPILVCLGIIGTLGLYSMLTTNITDKFANSSGIIRTRDFYVGAKLAMNHPILGVDVANLDVNPEAQALEDEIWGGTSVWTSHRGYFAGGYTNGLMGVLLDYGTILGLILYFFTFKSPILLNNKNRISPFYFYAIYCCSLIGEPISRTSLFFLFALSFLVNKFKVVSQDKQLLIR